MKRSRKSYRVSWADGPNLCQVKFFSPDEDDDLPPGFECNHFRNQSKAPTSQIKWKCPPVFAFNDRWRVAAGEESREKDYQKLREMKELEALYPHPAAIPSSPSVTSEVRKEDYDDNLTAIVPIIPIEEEASVDLEPEVVPAKLADTHCKLQSQNLPQHVPASTSPINSQCKPSSSTVPSSACGKPVPGASPCLEADLAAASAVVEAIMKSNEQGSLIDMDLLLRIFNDPIMIEKLIKEHRTAAASVSASSNTVGGPTSALKPVTSSVPFDTPTSTVGSLPVSGPEQATQSEPLLTPALDKPAIPSVSASSSTFDKPAIPSVSVPTSAFDKPATTSVPLFRPVSGKFAATHTLTLPTPPSSTPTTHMHKPANKIVPHVSSGMLTPLNTLSPQQDSILSSGLKRAASLASISSSEFSKVALPSASVNLPAVTNHVQSTARTVPYQSGTGSAFAVKDANYYKNLIRQHGADKQDMQDSQLGILNNKFQDLKSVPKIIKPGEAVSKTQKPCIYFNSSRGCRNGSNCPYKHEMPVQFGAGNTLVTQSAKRMKLGPEIKGCT